MLHKISSLPANWMLQTNWQGDEYLIVHGDLCKMIIINFFSPGIAMTRMRISISSPQDNTIAKLMSHSLFTAMEIICRWCVTMTQRTIDKNFLLWYSRSQNIAIHLIPRETLVLWHGSSNTRKLKTILIFLFWFLNTLRKQVLILSCKLLQNLLQTT